MTILTNCNFDKVSIHIFRDSCKSYRIQYKLELYKRIKSLLIPLFIGWFTFFPNSQCIASWEAPRCQDFVAAEREWNQFLPQELGEGTTLIKVIVNCEKKTLKFIKHIDSNVNNLGANWKQQNQLHHKQLHCNKNGLTAKYKWIAEDFILDKNFNYFTTIFTKPEHC